MRSHRSDEWVEVRPYYFEGVRYTPYYSTVDHVIISFEEYPYRRPR